jgi:integrase
MTTLELPNVHRFKNRHGKWQTYYRVAGRSKVRLHAEYLSPEFWQEYEAAKADAPRPEIGAGRSRAGTFNATRPGYFTSGEFLNLATGGQRTRRNILEHWFQTYGDAPVKDLQRKHVAAMIDAKATKPGAARDLLKALRSLMRFCTMAGLREDDPTVGVKLPRHRTEGFYSWDETDIAKYRAHHASGTRKRLAFELLLNTGLRRSDVVRIGRQHLRNGALHVKPKKTGGPVLVIPVVPELAAVIEATPSNNMTFLVTRTGAPFTAAGFGNHFREWCNEAGLPYCSAHGLRKAICRRLAEAGCSTLQIAAITGHKTSRLVDHYTAARDQELLARAAMASITGT